MLVLVLHGGGGGGVGDGGAGGRGGAWDFDVTDHGDLGDSTYSFGG